MGNAILNRQNEEAWSRVEQRLGQNQLTRAATTPNFLVKFVVLVGDSMSNAYSCTWTVILYLVAIYFRCLEAL